MEKQMNASILNREWHSRLEAKPTDFSTKPLYDIQKYIPSLQLQKPVTGKIHQ